MKPAVLWTTLLLAGFSLAGCEKNPIDRLMGVSDSREEPAAAVPADPGTAPNPAPPTGETPVPSTGTVTPPPPAPPRFETYRFEGSVIPGGLYYGAIAPGDRVSGTFEIDFEQPAVHTTGNLSVYLACARIEGTVGGYSFSGSHNYVYVKRNDTTAFFVDTGMMRLDGQFINFDLFFFLQMNLLPDPGLANLRDLDQRAYSKVDLWFETVPVQGQGFNARISSLQRVGAPVL